MKTDVLNDTSTSATGEIQPIYSDDYFIIEEMRGCHKKEYKEIAEKICKHASPYLILKALETAHLNGSLQVAGKFRELSQEMYGFGCARPSSRLKTVVRVIQ